MNSPKDLEFLMEEHHEAYFRWKELGVQNAWCWHFDAHLDIGREGLTPDRLAQLAPCRNLAQAADRDLLGNCYLPWGGLHCGNYLYPAIKEGIVGRLTWVIPPYLPTGDLLAWTRQHLDGWFEMDLASWASLHEIDGRIQGEILGIPIEVGVWENLQHPREPVLVDVDIDYFLTNDGQRWTEPTAIANALRTWSSLCTTVAYSVKGGYTPYQHRNLASAFIDQAGGSDYRPSALDQATTLYRCLRYEEALISLRGLTEEWPVDASYYLGSSYQKLQQRELALESWTPLCHSSEVSKDGQAYLHGLCGELCVELQRFDEAISHATAAKKLMPTDYRHPWTEAVAREQLGDPKAAIKLVRRALRLAEDTIFGLKIRLALVRLYRRQGQRELSRLELAKLATLDVTGEYAASTALVEIR